MKKGILLFMSVSMSIFLSAQTYTIISRNNPDTIKLYPNILGKAIKNLIPGDKEEDHYLLIKKVLNNKESLLFVEFSQDEKKILTSYETDLVTPGEWKVKVYTLIDIYAQMQRVNAILLRGTIIGIDIEMYQRPANFQDRMIIDGVEMPSPLKIVAIDEAQKLIDKQQKAQKEQQQKENISPTQKPEEPSANDYYIAYLISTNQFNESVETALLAELCSPSLYSYMAKHYDSSVLKIGGKGHDSRLEIYAK